MKRQGNHPPPLPAEALLIQTWRDQARITRTELSRRIDQLAPGLPSRTHRWHIPESTLRNMEKGSPASLQPDWRLAVIGLVCGGTPQDLRRAGRDDAAAKLAMLQQHLNEHGHLDVLEVPAPKAGRLIVAVPDDLTEEERQLVLLAAERFAESIRDKRPGTG